MRVVLERASTNVNWAPRVEEHRDCRGFGGNRVGSIGTDRRCFRLLSALFAQFSNALGNHLESPK